MLFILPGIGGKERRDPMALINKDKRKGLLAYASPWTVIGAALVMGAVVAALTAMNMRAQDEFVTKALREKGAALIKAFEAGTRTGMMGRLGAGLRMQELLEQTAAQEDIFYIAVTDATGRILADNERSLIGQSFVSPEEMRELAPADAEKWRFVEEGESGRRSFMVYRKFLPSLRGGAGSGNGRGPHGMGGPGMGGQRGPHGKGGQAGGESDFFCSDECDASGKPLHLSGMDLVIFVGMDVAPFEQARAAELRNTILAAGILLVLGLAGVVSLFWAQNYHAVRRNLRDTAAFADVIVGALPVGVAAADPDGRLSIVNAAAETLCGARAAEALGRPAAEILPGPLLALAESARDGAPSMGLETELECVFPNRKDQAPIPLGVGYAAVRTDEGRFVCDVFILRDLSEVRRLEEEVRRREKLAAIGKLAAGAAHEIRNPLSSIKGYAAYFGGKFPEGSEERESAAIMVREADRLNRVISELIEFARAGELRPRRANIGEIAAHSLRLIRPDAAAKGIAVETEGIEDAPDWVLDPDRITQALLNLLLNAVQAMDKGGALRLRAGVSPDGRAFFAVEDQGPGMDPETAARVFDPYFTTKAAGTGLGLTIAHNVAEAHGGEIVVASAPGKGSVFTLRLPRLHETNEDDTHEA